MNSNSTLYCDKSNAAYAKTLFDNLKSGNLITPLSSGFASLDVPLGGGFVPGLYVIGAVSSLGKTTFVSQIADNMAASGSDILYFSLEMERNQLILKAISRITYTLSQSEIRANTYNELARAKRFSDRPRHEQQLIEDAFGYYAQYADRIYVKDDMFSASVDSIKKAVVDHKKYTGNTPVVIVDYLQVLSGPRDGSDKQTMDHSVTALKSMSTELGVITLAISSLNRASYKLPVSLEAFKESGGIEYTADVLMGLQPCGLARDPKRFDIQEFKQQEVRDMEAVILKNRFGPVEDRICFNYRPRFNYFEEL